MGQITTFLEKKILDHILKVASYTPPASIYMGFSTTTPNPDGTNFTAPTYTGYARKQVTFNAAASRAITNNGIVTFDPCSSGNNTLTYWGLFDQLAGGNLLGYAALSTPKQVVAGNTPTVGDQVAAISFAAGALFTSFVHSVLNWVFGGGALTQPTNVKVGLSTTTPQDDGTGITEPVGNNYAQASFNTWKAATGSPEACYNDGTLALPTPSGSWGVCTYGVIYLDTNKAIYATIPSQEPNTGDTVEWLDAQFGVSLQ